MNMNEDYERVIEVVESKATEDEMFNIMQGRVLSGWDIASIVPLQWRTREHNGYQEHEVSLYQIVFIRRKNQ